MFGSKASGLDTYHPPDKIVKVIVTRTAYLYSLAAYFEDADFEFYDAVGQRNLSGFIGEVFVKIIREIDCGLRLKPPRGR